MKAVEHKTFLYDKQEGDRNEVLLRGWIDEPVKLDHQNESAAIYITRIRIERKPGVEDRIPIYIKENKLVFLGARPRVGDFMEIQGYFHSKDVYFDDQKRRMETFVYADKISFSTTDLPSVNEVHLSGVILKCRQHRVARNGQHLIDFLIKVRRKSHKFSRIPCIVWGAYKVVKIEDAGVGAQIELSGRIESREYIKCGDDKETSRMLYEISVKDFKIKAG